MSSSEPEINKIEIVTILKYLEDTCTSEKTITTTKTKIREKMGIQSSSYFDTIFSATMKDAVRLKFLTKKKKGSATGSPIHWCITDVGKKYVKKHIDIMDLGRIQDNVKIKTENKKRLKPGGVTRSESNASPLLRDFMDSTANLIAEGQSKDNLLMEVSQTLKRLSILIDSHFEQKNILEVDNNG